VAEQLLLCIDVSSRLSNLEISGKVTARNTITTKDVKTSVFNILCAILHRNLINALVISR